MLAAVLVAAVLRLTVLTFLSLAALGVVAAQEPRYTVQTVALQDYRQAQETAAQLRELSLDAYVDFAMFQGTQFARVRVGCYLDYAGAALLAQLLAPAVTREAAVAELSGRAAPSVCLKREVGFTLPQSWSEFAVAPEAVAYTVEVMGHRGVMVFTGETWRLAQTPDEAQALMAGAAALPVGRSAPLFEQQSRSGRPYVLVFWNAGTTLVANGTLLWQRGPFAVVLEGEAVVSYHAFSPRAAGSRP